MRRRRVPAAWAALFLVFTIRGTVAGIHGFNKIRPRKCMGADGRSGTCMFAMDCQKSDGIPLGTCVDGFLVGSCCGHDEQSNQILRPTPPMANEPPIFSLSLGLPSSTAPTWHYITKFTAPTSSKPIKTTSLVPLPGIVTARPHRPIIIRKTTPKTFSSTVRTTSAATTITTTTTRPPPSTISTFLSSTTTGVNLQLQKDCGRPRLTPQTRIVGGSTAVFGAWPWQASVRRTAFYGFASTHRCGGAVISAKWVATAGHCVDDLLLSQIRIRVGEYDFASVAEILPYVERSAQRKVVHPKYNFYTYDNDLALVLLDRSLDLTLPHIGPICLPSSDDLLVGKNATVTGWGRLSEGGVLPTILQEVIVPIVSNEKCNDMFFSANRPETIPDIMMCAGYTNGGKDSCQGDSGGPMQVRGDDGKWFLAGIISWGIGCGDPNLPGVCTRISEFKNWILQNAT